MEETPHAVFATEMQVRPDDIDMHRHVHNSRYLDYVLAARVAGKGKLKISVEHILTNIANVLIVQGTIQFSLGILAEAALSYVGLGAQPPTPSWGRMLADSQTMIALAPHLAIVPGLTIVVMVLALNLMGDGLRDLLDPRLRRAR